MLKQMYSCSECFKELHKISKEAAFIYLNICDCCNILHTNCYSLHVSEKLDKSLRILEENGYIKTAEDKGDVVRILVTHHGDTFCKNSSEHDIN